MKASDTVIVAPSSCFPVFEYRASKIAEKRSLLPLSSSFNLSPANFLINEILIPEFSCVEFAGEAFF